MKPLWVDNPCYITIFVCTDRSSLAQTICTKELKQYAQMSSSNMYKWAQAICIKELKQYAQMSSNNMYKWAQTLWTKELKQYAQSAHTICTNGVSFITVSLHLTDTWDVCNIKQYVRIGYKHAETPKYGQLKRRWHLSLKLCALAGQETRRSAVIVVLMVVGEVNMWHNSLCTCPIYQSPSQGIGHGLYYIVA